MPGDRNGLAIRGNLNGTARHTCLVLDEPLRQRLPGTLLLSLESPHEHDIFPRLHVERAIHVRMAGSRLELRSRRGLRCSIGGSLVFDMSQRPRVGVAHVTIGEGERRDEAVQEQAKVLFRCSVKIYRKKSDCRKKARRKTATGGTETEAAGSVSGQSVSLRVDAAARRLLLLLGPRGR